MQNANFDSDITDAQWELLAPMLPKPAATGRPPAPRRLMINVILYLTNAGCPWHLLPKSFPPYKPVFHIFRRWTKASILASIHDRLRAHAREEAERCSRPTQAIMDNQTVRSEGMAAEVGYDAGKKAKGHKRFVMVDTLGYILTILVTTADTTERNGRKDLLAAALGYLALLRKVWIDGGFSGPDFAKHAVELRAKLEIEVVKRSDTT